MNKPNYILVRGYYSSSNNKELKQKKLNVKH